MPPSSRRGHQSFQDHQRIYGGIILQGSDKGALSDLYPHLHLCTLLLTPSALNCCISRHRLRRLQSPARCSYRRFYIWCCCLVFRLNRFPRLLRRNAGRLRHRWNGPFSVINICFWIGNFRYTASFPPPAHAQAALSPAPTMTSPTASGMSRIISPTAWTVMRVPASGFLMLTTGVVTMACT